MGEEKSLDVAVAEMLEKAARKIRKEGTACLYDVSVDIGYRATRITVSMPSLESKDVDLK